MRLEPIPDEAALLVDGRTLAVADLHLGREAELRERGFVVPRQGPRLAGRIEGLLRATGAERLVVVGDLKHRVARLSGLERRELPPFIAALRRSAAEVHVVRGNHDVGLEYYLPAAVRLHPATGVVLDGIGYCHGHTWPAAEVMAAEALVLAHTHPALLFRDRLGPGTTRRCWLRLAFRGPGGRYARVPREAVILPAFGEFSGGTAVNEEGGRLLGPLLQGDLVDVPAARVYLLDGTYLGPLRDLGVPRRKGRRGRGGRAGPEGGP